MDREPKTTAVLSTRRRFLAAGGLAALAAAHRAPAAVASAPKSEPSSPIRIIAVDAYPMYVNGRTQGVHDVPRFAADDDPRRWTYDGPLSQLPSAIIAIVKTDQGIVGFGMGGGGSVAVEIIHAHLRHLLLGTNPLQVERLWDQMYSSALFYGRRGIFAMALSAVDNAIWDIAGKHADRPVYRMLGVAEPRDRIAVYQTGGDIRQGKEQGIRNFKLFPRVGPETPKAELDRVVEEVLQARQTLGPEGNLMTDCVSRTGTVEWAVDFAERLRPANLYFMEELLSPDDVFGYAELVRRIGGAGKGWTRIACGEHEYTQHGFDVLLRLQSAEVLQPDITWCGGLTAGRRIARMVEEAGRAIIPHRGGSLWGLPIALTSPSCTMAESFPSGSELFDAMSPRLDKGHFLAPEGPGFGTSLSEELVLEHRLRK